MSIDHVELLESILNAFPYPIVLSTTALSSAI